MFSTRKTNTLKNNIEVGQGSNRKYSLMSGWPKGECEDSAIIHKEIGLENTYKMVPDRKFMPGKVKKCIQQILEIHLKDEEYNQENAKELCLELSDKIKSKVKEEYQLDRFKLVCEVHIGKQFNQGVQITSRCLWNPHFDTYSTECFMTDKIFGQASVFAVYVE